MGWRGWLTGRSQLDKVIREHAPESIQLPFTPAIIHLERKRQIMWINDYFSNLPNSLHYKDYHICFPKHTVHFNNKFQLFSESSTNLPAWHLEWYPRASSLAHHLVSFRTQKAPPPLHTTNIYIYHNTHRHICNPTTQCLITPSTGKYITSVSLINIIGRWHFLLGLKRKWAWQRIVDYTAT